MGVREHRLQKIELASQGGLLGLIFCSRLQLLPLQACLPSKPLLRQQSRFRRFCVALPCPGAYSVPCSNCVFSRALWLISCISYISCIPCSGCFLYSIPCAYLCVSFSCAAGSCSRNRPTAVRHRWWQRLGEDRLGRCSGRSTKATELTRLWSIR